MGIGYFVALVLTIIVLFPLAWAIGWVYDGIRGRLAPR